MTEGWACAICGAELATDEIAVEHVEGHQMEKEIQKSLDELVKVGIIEEYEDGYWIKGWREKLKK